MRSLDLTLPIRQQPVQASQVRCAVRLDPVTASADAARSATVAPTLTRAPVGASPGGGSRRAGAGAAGAVTGVLVSAARACAQSRYRKRPARRIWSWPSTVSVLCTAVWARALSQGGGAL